MGKLHTLRRAVQRDPEKWFEIVKSNNKNYASNKKKASDFVKESITFRRSCSATKKKSDWSPSPSWGRNSYRGFVKSVLKDMGYENVF